MYNIACLSHVLDQIKSNEIKSNQINFYLKKIIDVIFIKSNFIKSY